MRFLALFIPFLLTFASLLQLNYIASMVVSPGQILRPLAVMWLLLGLLIWPAYKLTRDWNWTALLLSALVMGFYFASDFFMTTILLIILVGVIWLAVVRLRRMKIAGIHFVGILAAVSVFLTIYASLLMGMMLGRVDWRDYEREVEEAGKYSLTAAESPAIKPDIYYIVLDGYGRSDVLLEMYGFDNSAFINDLREKGFIVPESNHSNYPATPLSVASTLNMDYVQSLASSLDQNPHRWLMAPFIDNGRVRSFLESQGYKTVTLSTNWTITENDTADLYFHPFPVMLTDFEGFVLGSTPLHVFGWLLGNFVQSPTADSHREIIRYNFETLAALPETPGPKFVFAHIISPHPPFVFDSNGNPVDPGQPFTFQDANEFSGTSKEYSQKYFEQVQFVNTNLHRLIETILASSETPPIIIIQADHGPGMLTDLGSADNTCIRERFSPFAAYFLPGVDNRIIPSDISSVNIFRIVLNEYFDAGLPLLEDKQYFNKDMQAYYEFEDVTGRINEKCVLPGE